jgi:NlpC/P60 family putative phage cell wall peptidase
MHRFALHRARDREERQYIVANPSTPMPHLLTRAAIVAEARAWIGTPYRHQGSVKGAGCDCLGLVRGVWRGCIGREPEMPPPYAPDWAEAAGRETLAQAAARHLKPVAREGFGAGDVLLFRWRDGYVAKHAAIASGEGTMIHAHDGAAVCEVALTSWWRRHLAYAFRFPGVTE